MPKATAASRGRSNSSDFGVMPAIVEQLLAGEAKHLLQRLVYQIAYRSPGRSLERPLSQPHRAVKPCTKSERSRLRTRATDFPAGVKDFRLLADGFVVRLWLTAEQRAHEATTHSVP